MKSKIHTSINFFQNYGNYFLAEIIEAEDEDNHTLVAEVNGKAIAFMNVSSHVNVNLLQVINFKTFIYNYT